MHVLSILDLMLPILLGTETTLRYIFYPYHDPILANVTFLTE